MGSRITLAMAAVFLAALISIGRPAAANAAGNNVKLGKLTLQECQEPDCTFNVAVGYGAMQGPNGACTADGVPLSCCRGLGRGDCPQRSSSVTAVGWGAMLSNYNGYQDCAFGTAALYSNTSGANNTAVGALALYANSSGNDNTAVGSSAMFANTIGHTNTALGAGALATNDTGSENTAIGTNAMVGNLTGDSNTAVGVGALQANTTGNENTALGEAALNASTTGGQNTAIGRLALEENTTGNINTALGNEALRYNTDGASNTAVGQQALGFNTSGSNNIAVGQAAGMNLTTGNRNIDIGAAGIAGESATIRIGTETLQTATFIAGIRGTTTGVADGVAVLIDSNGQLGTMSSSRRFKTDIQDMGDVSDALLRLRPVTFKYKPELDASGATQYGLVAEEVAEVFPALVARDKNGNVETVKYHLLAGLLLDVFQKEHAQRQKLESRVNEVEQTLAKQTQQLQALGLEVEQARAQRQQIETLAARLSQLEAVTRAPPAQLVAY